MQHNQSMNNPEPNKCDVDAEGTSAGNNAQGGNDFTRLDFAPSEYGQSEATEEALQLDRQSRALKDRRAPKAQFLKEEYRRMLAKQLNELDGFDR